MDRVYREIYDHVVILFTFNVTMASSTKTTIVQYSKLMAVSYIRERRRRRRNEISAKLRVQLCERNMVSSSTAASSSHLNIRHLLGGSELHLYSSWWLITSTCWWMGDGFVMLISSRNKFGEWCGSYLTLLWHLRKIETKRWMMKVKVIISWLAIDDDEENKRHLTM